MVVEAGSGNSTSSAVTSSIQTTQYSLIWVGIGVSVAGNFLISLSFQIQKAVHNNLEKVPEKERLPYTKIPRWWFGLLCMAFGEVGNFLAYGMAPASLVSPLGAVTVVSNAILSRIILKESLSYRKMLGIVFCLFGAVLISINAPAPESGASGSSDGRGTQQPDTAIYDSLISWRAFVYLCIVIFLILFIANPFKWKFAVSEELAKTQVIFYCLVCGLLGAITIMSSKGISTAINQAFAGDPKMLADGRICWLTYLLILSAAASIVLQMKYLNAALETFESGKVVPVYYIIFTTITISAGMCLFLEISFDPLVRSVLLFVLGLLLAFFGVFLIGGDTAGTKKQHMELPTEEVEILRLIFKDLDRDNNQKIDQTEIAALASALKEEWKDKDRADIMDLIDKDKSGEINFDEFQEWYQTVAVEKKDLLKVRAAEIVKELGTAADVVGISAPGGVVAAAINLQGRLTKQASKSRVIENGQPAGGGGGPVPALTRKETLRTAGKKASARIAAGKHTNGNGASDDARAAGGSSPPLPAQSQIEIAVAPLPESITPAASPQLGPQQDTRPAGAPAAVEMAPLATVPQVYGMDGSSGQGYPPAYNMMQPYGVYGDGAGYC